MNNSIAPVAASNNRAGLALFGQMSKPENLVFSPLGVYCILRMLTEGARGDTRAALTGFLAPASELPELGGLGALLETLASHAQLQPSEAKELDEAERRLQDMLKMASPAARTDPSAMRLAVSMCGGTVNRDTARMQLSVATGVWLQQGTAFGPEFFERMRATLGAEVKTLDFRRDPQSACETINAWIEGKTHGCIPSMLSRQEVAAATHAILANTVYFKGRWAQEFQAPEPGPFRLLDGTEVHVPMVTNSFGSLVFIRTPECWVAELPYYKRPICMTLFVPNERGAAGLAETERIVAERWNEIHAARRTVSNVDFTLPEFKFGGRSDLSSVLGRLGLETIFSAQADFSGMTDAPGFYLDNILHDTRIAVDRYGTEAAAATVAGMTIGFPPEDPDKLVVDRPFMFAIVERETGAILFLGKVVDPR